MDGVKKNFGFGCMGLAMVDGAVDILQTNKKEPDTMHPALSFMLYYSL